MLNRILYGRKRELILPNGERRTAQFAIVDLNEIIASHNEETFSSSTGYPVNEQGRNINDRNYQDDTAAQKNVVEIAQHLNPESLIELSSKPSGTPIIDKNGFVVSGNNRTMSLKLAVKRYPENYQRYKEYLVKEIDVFGFKDYVGPSLLANDDIPLPGSSYNEPKSVKFDYPVLVRIDEDIPALNTTELAKYNMDTRKGERPVDKLIKLSNILRENDRCRQMVISIVEGYETFSEFFGPGGQPANDRKRLLQTFLDCGMITEAKMPDFYTDGQFTDAGKDFIENILSSIILEPDALKVAGAEGVKRFRQIIISSLPVLMANTSLPAGTLKPFINEAVIVQYRIQQVGSFKDYIVNQGLFDEAQPDFKSLIINRLLEQGRNKFKEQIIKYNEGVKSNTGDSLFGESQLTVEQIFKITIMDAIPPSELTMIQGKFGGQPKENVALPPTVTAEFSSPEETVADVNLFFDDNFFKANPDKILGEPYTASGRFGPVTKYKGDLTVLSRIDVPNDFLGDQKILNNPLLSVGQPDNMSAELTRPSVEGFIRNINKESEKAVAAILSKKQRKKSRILEDEDIITKEVPELQTFEEIYAAYNPEISPEELQAFVWFKSHTGRPLSRRWARLIDKSIGDHNLNETYHYSVPDEKIKQWLADQLLYYYNGNLIPTVLYLSGDIYDKKFQLERDRYEIIEKYGQSVYDQQEAQLSAVFKEKYNKRLIITGTEAETGLVILPNSKFAEDFFIERIETIPEGDNFKIKQVTATSAKRYLQPDFFKDADTKEEKKHHFSQLNLKDAFAYWLLKHKPELTENISHEEIVKYYLQNSPIRTNLTEHASQAEVAAEKAQFAKLKASIQKDAERLFIVFLDKEVTLNDKVRLETTWNAKYNNYVPVNYNKIPVAFTMTRFYKGKPEHLRPEKREAVAFDLTAGSACLAYDVGVGKTPSSIFTISAFIDAGYCKRPFVCVPNQVYKQFISEIKGFVPHIPVIEAYNLGDSYAENFKDASGKIAPVPEGTITVMTYEGLERIGFSDSTYDELFNSLYEILNQGGESERQQTQRQVLNFEQRLQTILGKGLRGSLFNIEDFGFDFGCYDEAHRLKKIFTAVKGEMDTQDGKSVRGKSPYAINSGQPSSIGLKGFMLNQYIQKRNFQQNILLLTATPFTNSPLEIFSMLAMLGYEQLQNTDLNNIKTFFDTYIKTSTELVINPQLKPVFKQVILGFNNLISLQSLIRRYINYKTGEDVNVQRPKKIVLPYTHKMVDGTILKLSDEEKVESFIPMTERQFAMMSDIISYVEGKITLSVLSTAGNQQKEKDIDIIPDDDESVDASEEEEIDEESLGNNEKIGVRVLRGINLAQNLALSPYLYPYSGMGKPDFHQYIETSPKLKYTMECIKTVKAYHEAKNEPISGQVIYMNRGIEYFELIREYLVQEVGYKAHEVGIIRSGLPSGNKKGSKEFVKNLFNGEIYNDNTKLFESVPDNQRIKVLIGSGTIQEGVNLQRYGTLLYILWQDWNPTVQQQITGRIWRQGNLYDAVRIVNPLLINSMDIFVFQKLEEKTSRLNTIWASDGRSNVLKLEEFDPSELKYALMRDPAVIASLKIVDEEAAIDSKIIGITRLQDRIDRIIEHAETINNHFDDLAEFIAEYRFFEKGSDKLKDASKIVLLINEAFKSQTDKEGKPLISLHERNEMWASQRQQYSDLGPVNKPYIFDAFNLAQRNLTREQKEFLTPSGIRLNLTDLTSLTNYKEQQEKEIANLRSQKDKLNDPKNIDKLVREIKAEREEKKISYKSLMQAVADFAKLNYLLSEKKIVSTVVVPQFETCPPMENGERLITEEAISYLDTCIERETDTKILHTNEAGSYTQERQDLHDQIVADEFKHVRCIKRGSPIAVFTGGSPGSGKSRFLEAHADYLLSPDIFHLDADEIRKALPEYQGWNATIAHRETQDIVNELLDKVGHGNCRYDFIYDGTMNKAQKYFKLIQRVKNMGYETFILFMDVPYGVAKKRVLDRYKKTGRFVPSIILDEFFEQLPNGKTRGKDALDQLKAIVDGYLVVDGVTGKVIEKGGKSLPKDRSYGDFLEPSVLPEDIPQQGIEEVSVEADTIAEPGNKKQVAENQIRALQVSAKFLKGNDKKKAEKQIKGLQLSLKYL